MMDAPDNGDAAAEVPQHADSNTIESDETLKYHLLGPSLTKAGQDKVDQQKVRCVAIHASWAALQAYTCHF